MIVTRETIKMERHEEVATIIWIAKRETKRGDSHNRNY
jgi:hypothetical protein